MKKYLLMAAVAMMAAASAQAQKMEIVDKDGNAVPYASVMTADATLIGVTGMDGVIADIGGAKTVVISHVAYQPKTVSILGDSSFSGLGNSPNDQTTNAPNDQSCLRVTLDDADFNLPEITVTKKDYTYLQMYYRVIIIDKDGVLYYRSGIMDNFLNEKNGKQESSKQHITMSKSGTMKVAFNLLLGDKIDAKAKIHQEPLEQSMLKKFKSQGLRFVDAGNGKKNIVDNYGTLGSVVDRDGQRRFTIDAYQSALHRLEAEGKTKKLEKRLERDAKMENRVNSSYRAYAIDESGHYRPEDYLMEQHMMTWEDSKNGHALIIMDYFATDRAYLSKEQVKQTKRDNKVKLSYNYLQQFERQHRIPALAPEVLAKMKELVDKD